MKKCKLVQNIMNFKFCYIIFCAIICFIVLSVPTFAKENSDNVIRVGSFEETYNVVNEKGERSGYGYEYLQDIAGYAGWTYKYITSDWKNCFTQLENGEIDILGDISYTDERAENMLFSDMPMGEEKYYCRRKSEASVRGSGLSDRRWRRCRCGYSYADIHG